MGEGSIYDNETRGYRMSTLKVLKEYLVGESGYLLNEDNNGKTVMLSGAWGSGKTHFWQKRIENDLIGKLKDKACVYVSLYGKDNIEDIKSEVFLKAYSQLGTKNNKNIDTALAWLGHGSKIASAISFWGVKIDTTQITDKATDYQDNDKLNKAQEAIKDGGVICFDDFERKSKYIDLNDLFGVITQLSLDFNCKVVIILNSDVFEGEEANVFKTVKEKTVNKFFDFEPTIEELFNSIFYSKKKDKKYKYICLRKYKTEIFKTIKETEELNARIYIQVLDNCLEWLHKYKYNKYELRALVLITINFLKNHFVFEYRKLEQLNNLKLYTVLDKYYQDNGLSEIARYFIRVIPQISPKIEKNDFENYLNGNRDNLPVEPHEDSSEFLHSMYSSISKKETEKKTNKKNDKETTKENTQSESYYEKLDAVFNENKNIFSALYFYAYLLDIEYGIDKEKFDEINQFVKSGIILKEDNK